MGFHWPFFSKPKVVFVTRQEPTKRQLALRRKREGELIDFLASKGIAQPEQLRAARELGASVRLGRSA